MTEQRDIVERLMNYTTCTDSDVDEAAAEITRLREQLRIAREGLVKLAKYEEGIITNDLAAGFSHGLEEAADYARDTLARMEARND